MLTLLYHVYALPELGIVVCFFCFSCSWSQLPTYRNSVLNSVLLRVDLCRFSAWMNSFHPFLSLSPTLSQVTSLNSVLLVLLHLSGLSFVLHYVTLYHPTALVGCAPHILFHYFIEPVHVEFLLINITYYSHVFFSGFRIVILGFRPQLN